MGQVRHRFAHPLFSLGGWLRGPQGEQAGARLRTSSAPVPSADTQALALALGSARRATFGTAVPAAPAPTPGVALAEGGELDGSEGGESAAGTAAGAGARSSARSLGVEDMVIHKELGLLDSLLLGVSGRFVLSKGLGEHFFLARSCVPMLQS